MHIKAICRRPARRGWKANSLSVRRLRSADFFVCPRSGTIRAMLDTCRMTLRPSACGSSTAGRSRRRAMGRLRAGAGLGRQPVPQPPLPEGAGGFQVGRPAHRLATAVSPGRKRADGTLQGRRPLYVKGHSQGEYVFDHGWAQAFERAGGRYYPKLQVASSLHAGAGPAPVRAPRPVEAAVRDAMIDMLAKIAGDNRHQLGPCHLLHRGRLETLRRARLAAAAGPAVSLAQCTATARSTISWRRSPRASARRSARSARRSGARA